MRMRALQWWSNMERRDSGKTEKLKGRKISQYKDWKINDSNYSYIKQKLRASCKDAWLCKYPRTWIQIGLRNKLKFEAVKDDRKDWRQEKGTGWDGWMASLTQWTWVWASSGKEWRTGLPAAVHGVAKNQIEQLNNNRVVIHTRVRCMSL